MQPTLEGQPVYVDHTYDTIGSVGRYVFSIRFVNLLHVLLTLIIIALISSIIYSLVRLYEIKKEDEANAPVAVPPGIGPTATSEGVVPHPDLQTNPVWDNVRAKLLSDNPSDWRLAIIEADIYLDHVLDSKGFHGDTLSDKLKQVTPDILGSVQIAWEAHKVRNRIAHDGSAFILTMPEARRVLSYYEIVFRDLEVIA